MKCLRVLIISSGDRLVAALCRVESTFLHATRHARGIDQRKAARIHYRDAKNYSATGFSASV